MIKEQKPKLYIIAGPTAVGKTKASLLFAKKINAEIISADSMQVYKGMDIGTAKLKENETEGIRHHLIDIFSPFDEFNIAIFKDLAKKAIEDIHSRGMEAVLVGGTGFYIQSVLYDTDFNTGESDKNLRESLSSEYDEKGADYMYNKLKALDEKSAEIIHPNNKKRIVRAIEFVLSTDKKISEHNINERSRKSPYNYKYFVLNSERKKLYNRIEQRVDMMIDQGLVDEVRKLHEIGCNKDMVSMKGIGYKEILKYIDGEIGLEEAIDLIKKETRHFAKRQITWFKREKEAIWLDIDDFTNEEELVEYMIKGEE